MPHRAAIERGFTKRRLTQQHIQQMESLLSENRRSSMYLYYANITGSKQAEQQAEISSLQGYYGTIALEANRRSYEKIVEDLGHGWYPKEGIESFSYDISRRFLDDVKRNYAAGGGGILSEDQMVESAKQVWREKGIGDYFPGNLLQREWGAGANSAVEAALVYSGILEGRGIIPAIPDHDDYYTPPLGGVRPEADNPISGGGIGSFFTAPSSRQIAQNNKVGDLDFGELMGEGVESLLKRGVLKDVSPLAREAIQIGVEGVIRAIRQQQSKEAQSVTEGAFQNVLLGKDGRSGLMQDIVMQASQVAVSKVMGNLFGDRERTTVYASESARSKAEARKFRLSKSQQAEDLLALLAKGRRNG